MADCWRIIRLLKDVKRKADYSFVELNKKIGNMEGQYNLLNKQIQSLKKEVDENVELEKNSVKPIASTSGSAKNGQKNTLKLGKRRRLRRRRTVGRRKKLNKKSRLTSANKGRAN